MEKEYIWREVKISAEGLKCAPHGTSSREVLLYSGQYLLIGAPKAGGLWVRTRFLTAWLPNAQSWIRLGVGGVVEGFFIDVRILSRENKLDDNMFVAELALAEGGQDLVILTERNYEIWQHKPGKDY